MTPEQWVAAAASTEPTDNVLTYVQVKGGTIYGSDRKQIRYAPTSLLDGLYDPATLMPVESPKWQPNDAIVNFLARLQTTGEFASFENKVVTLEDGYYFPAKQLRELKPSGPMLVARPDDKPIVMGGSKHGGAFVLSAHMPKPKKPEPVEEAVIQKSAVFQVNGVTSLMGCYDEDGEYEVQPDMLLAGTVIQNVGMGVSTVLPSMDFETYSEAGFIIDENTGKVHTAARTGKQSGLGLVGTAVYAAHPTTEVLCLYYDLKDGKGRRAYFPGGPQPTDLLEHIANMGPVEAWNITFEWWIWNMVCAKQFGWPFLQFEQCHCAMAKARRYGLPGALGLAAKALGTADKDKEGKRLIGKLCRPVSATKKRPQPRWTMATATEDYSKLFAYCDQDVKSEDHAAARIPDLTPDERQTWLADQRINARGVMVDVPSLDACLAVVEMTARRFTIELAQITGGEVGSVAEVKKLTEYLASIGCHMHDMKADTVQEALKREDLNPTARRVLEIREALAGANVKKLYKLKAQVSSDGRLRNQYMFFGASQTGRWSSAAADDSNGSNAQLQNITSKGPKSKQCTNCGQIVGVNCRVEVMGVPGGCPQCGGNEFEKCNDWTVDAVRCALADIARRDLDYLIDVWGDPVKLLSGCLRGLFIAAPGKKFICCDFSAVEAVGLAALSRCQWRLDVFNGHGKIYEMSASKISGVPFEEFMEYKKVNGFDHPLRKSLGKVAELASGYGGWVGAWNAFGAEEHFDSEEELKQAILGWRNASPEIVELWGGQRRKVNGRWVNELFGLEGAAIAAIQNPGRCYAVHDITYGVKDDVLFCRLPSGRFIQYHEPRLAEVEKWGRTSLAITFTGYNSNSQKGQTGWVRMETYGGRLAENVTQAVCADIQAEAMKACENNGYPIVMHTHDELIAEVDENFGSVDEMAALMTQPQPWRSWWPLRAAGWEDDRYQKD
ncbi:DNA polymerase [Vibrio phage CKB-S1]|nr:DNA polymerase [Vibrio phage CKB-S1]